MRSTALLEPVYVFASRADCVAARIQLPFSKRPIFNNDQVRLMLRLVTHPRVELCICGLLACKLLYLVMIYFVDPFAHRFGSLLLIFGFVIWIWSLPLFALWVLTLQVEIAKRSFFNFFFFFNLTISVLFGVYFCFCYRGTIWVKLWMSSIVVIGYPVLQGLIEAVQCRRWMKLTYSMIYASAVSST
jgi:hypothetical protein